MPGTEDGIELARIESELGMQIVSLSCDSRLTQPGDVFLAYPGADSDGRRHAGEAVRAGAAAVLWDPDGADGNPDWGVPSLPLPGLRKNSGHLAAAVCGDPTRDMRIIAVTGTNGKTTTAWFTAMLLANLTDSDVGYFGTAGQGVMGALEPSSLTTPDAISLQKGFRRLADRGIRHAVIEASSHGICQHRLEGTAYDVAVFTNLSRDHLDYHGTQEEYARSKEMLFERDGLEAAIVNADDQFGRALAERLDGKVILGTYGCEGSRVRLLRIGYGQGRMCVGAELDGREHEWSMGICGAHNAHNAAAAMLAVRLCGFRWGEVLPAMERLELPPGRLQRVTSKAAGPAVYVDYAHTPYALEQALSGLRSMHPSARIMCVFGCGGDRDQGKRSEMGRVARDCADRVCITSDNPRTEDPASIMRSVREGAGDGALMVEDRAQAIFAAVRESASGDVVLVAGKGHERFQLVGDRRLPFDDVAVAEAALAEAGT